MFSSMRRFFHFSQWPILPKIMTISVISLSFITTVILCYFSPRLEQRMLEEKKTSLRNLVEVAYGVFHQYEGLVQQGRLTQKEAQEQVIRSVANLGSDPEMYFWINDTSLKMIMHPIRPELNNTTLAQVKDPTGKPLFRDMVRTAKRDGSGFVDYLWPKPGETEPAAKISYVKLYEPWGWILGSGMYVDDIKKEMAKLRHYLIVGTVLFALVTLTCAALIGRGITRPLKKVIDGLKDIANGKGDAALTKRIAITSIDEIGLLSTEFNSLMESINDLNLFKKVIEEDETVEEVYLRLGEVFSRQPGFLGCAIHRVEGDLERLRQVYPEPGGAEPFCDQGLANDCTSCKAQRSAHVVSSLEYPGACRRFRGSGERDHHCIPIVVGGRSLGVVQFILKHHQEGDAATQPQTRIYKAEQYLKEALPVIETKRLMAALRESALRDPLTNLHNRRYLQEYTETLIAGAIRRGKKIGLIMCDLDFFKEVNDTYGHNAGDIVLRHTASVIRRSVRAADIVVRFGGEEFLVVLLDIGSDDAMLVAEKIRVQVQNSQITLPDCTIKKTISLGVTEFSTGGEGLWHCIKFADVALYQAKERGRNCCVKFVKEMWPQEHF